MGWIDWTPGWTKKNHRKWRFSSNIIFRPTKYSNYFLLVFRSSAILLRPEWRNSRQWAQYTAKPTYEKYGKNVFNVINVGYNVHLRIGLTWLYWIWFTCLAHSECVAYSGPHTKKLIYPHKIVKQNDWSRTVINALRWHETDKLVCYVIIK